MIYSDSFRGYEGSRVAAGAEGRLDGLVDAGYDKRFWFRHEEDRPVDGNDDKAHVNGLKTSGARRKPAQSGSGICPNTPSTPAPRRSSPTSTAATKTSTVLPWGLSYS